MIEYCSDIKHLRRFILVKCPYCGKGKIKKEIQAYSYGCPKCWDKCDVRKKPLKNGNWCNCECHHNVLHCRTCGKPIKLINGKYYFTYKEVKQNT